MKKNVPGRFVHKLSGWRHMATSTWRAPNDPTIYGTIEIDAAAALDLISELNARGGPHVTMTHVVTKAIADTLAEHPECNAYVRFGRIYERDDVDVFVLVAVPPAPGEVGHEQKADLSGVKVRNADRKTVLEIANEVSGNVPGLRKGRDPHLGSVKRLLSALPHTMVTAGLELISRVQYDLNVDLSPIGVPRDPFGCAIVTSMGMFGVEHAFPPLIPMTRLSAVLAVGRAEEQPVVRDGQIVARPMLPLTATFDHRVIDGFQGGKLGGTFKALMSDPPARWR